MGKIWLERAGSLKSLAFIAGVFIFFIASQQNAVAAPTAEKAEKIEFWDDSEEHSRFSIKHGPWDAILKKYVIVDHPSGINRFDYDAVTTADKESLDNYLKYMQSMDPRQSPKERQKAYWINLFNATLVHRVLNSSSIDSIQDLGGRFWKRKKIKIAMQKISLNDIEHGILRPIFKDPRVHFSLVEGAEGAANILPQAFTMENVDELLEQNTRDFIAHQRGVSQGNDGGLVLSTIFKWYEEDFGGDLNGVKQFVSPYVAEELSQLLAQATEVTYEYDWSLNKPE